MTQTIACDAVKGVGVFGNHELVLGYAVNNSAEDLKPYVDKCVQEATAAPTVRPETKCKMIINDREGAIFCESYENCKLKSTRRIMPDIDDVRIIEQKVDDHTSIARAVIVTFKDGTSSKATFNDGDWYSLEYGISVCITKRLLGEHGSSLYNKIVRRAMRVKAENDEAARRHAEEEARIANKLKKLAAKRAAKKARREAQQRESKIDMIAEAVVRAMQKINFNKASE